MSGPGQTGKVVVAALVIFAAGVVVGGLTVRTRQAALGGRAPLAGVRSGVMGVPWSGERLVAQQRELMRRLDRHLNLSAEQRVRVEAILRESHQRLKGMWEKVAPQTQEELHEMRARVREVLTEEQKVRFEDVFKSRPVWGKDDRRGHGEGGTNGVSRPSSAPGAK